MFNSNRIRISFLCQAVIFTLGFAALTACAKEEAAKTSLTEPRAAEVQDEQQADAVVKGEVAEVDAVDAVAVEQAADAESTSLRDRITTTPPLESWKPTWSQAVTPQERRANLEEALAAESGPYVIDMHDLGGWELDEREENPIPDYILALDGKEFIMRGFMMPDIDFEHIRSFHLVRSLFSCCFGAPPQINEIMRVTLADEDGMDYTYNTVEIRGRLTVTFDLVDGLVEDIFRLENATYRILEFDDPDAPDSFDASTGFDSVVPSGPKEY